MSLGRAGDSAEDLVPDQHEIELLVFGFDTAQIEPFCRADDFGLIDAGGVHARIAATNQVDLSGDWLGGLRVPFVESHIWEMMTRMVGGQRAKSTRWVVSDSHMALFLPLWKHVIPSARAIGPTPVAGSEQAQALGHFAERYPNDLAFVDLTDAGGVIAAAQRSWG
ncbi:MAG: hypothetical protein V3V01_16550 [Acidimicrobiales bacterium]